MPEPDAVWRWFQLSYRKPIDPKRRLSNLDAARIFSLRGDVFKEVAKNRFDRLGTRASAAPAKAIRRGNSAYCQFSAYLPQQLYEDVKIQLVRSKLDLSEAAELAFRAWLKAV